MKRLRHALGPAVASAALVCGLVATPIAVAATPASSSPAHTPSPDATDGIIITLEDEAGQDVRSREARGGISTLADAPVVSDLADAGVEVTDTLDTANDMLLQAEPADGQTDAEALAAAQAVDGVASVQYNFRYDLIGAVEGDAEADDASDASSASGIDALAMSDPPTNDPFAAQDSPSTDVGNQYWLYDTGLVDAWDQVKAQGAVTVAVVDSGCDLDHPDVASNVLADLAYDADGSHMLAGSAVEDSQGHGTAVTSVIAGVTNNGVGLAGASYDAKVLPIKVFDDKGGGCYTDDLVRAYQKIFEYIDGDLVENLHVINMSLGAHDSSEVPAGSEIGVDGMRDEVLEGLISTARDRYDIATVCAGGNGHPSGVSACTYANYPSDFEDCIAVTALATDGSSLNYSDYNRYKDISTYGEDIWAAWRGSSSNSSPYVYRSGTSLAAPIVSGTIALMFAERPAATVDDVCEALYETATAISYDMSDPVDAERAATTGSHGALDADAAVAYIADHVAAGPDIEPVPFDDVQQGDWFYGAVSFVYSNGIMRGYQDEGRLGTFGPDDATSRSQLAQILYNLADAPETDASYTDNYVDCVPGAWYMSAISWATQQGLMSGYDDGTNRFDPDAALTREQLAVVLWRAAGKPSTSESLENFSDSAQTSSWAVEAMEWAVSVGLFQGYDNTDILNPSGVLTRAQMAMVLYRQNQMS
ncbi:S8 family peptidase [Enorma phocaeensis]|uniref:S8 family peptidase n=1 Tax=Enorma phocaeensis TaxID=1871019 RepID=UPI0019560E02|nr:S8 family serine peptidase [Enorma phocaeensis]MBM6953082.1 S8 family serine peptidase [Enorma phocaeensis]